MCWIDMLQIVISFCAGVYVGTEYEMLPYVDKVRDVLGTIEKKDKPPVEDKPAPAKRSSWFGWGKQSQEKAKDS